MRFNAARIEQLVDQLYSLNRRLIGFEGQILRMAERCKVRRDEFLKCYFGAELDPDWLQNVQKSAEQGLEGVCRGARRAGRGAARPDQ